MVQAGTTKKGDLLVNLELTSDEQITLQLSSKVAKKYGDSIRTSILETLAEFNITGAKLEVDDQGALDFVIRARVETAIKRALAEVKV